MILSSTADRYLLSLSRDTNWAENNVPVIKNYLVKQDIQVVDAFVAYQRMFSGYTLLISNQPLSSFKAMLISKSDIVSNREITKFNIDGHYYLHCGEHESAQFWFVLNQFGEIGTYDNTDKRFNPLFSSFEKLIETYAAVNSFQILRKYEHSPYFDLQKEQEFDDHTKGYENNLDLFDKYNMWLSKDGLVIQKARWFDRPGSFVHVYGIDSKSCELFIKSLLDKDIIKLP